MKFTLRLRLAVVASLSIISSVIGPKSHAQFENSLTISRTNQTVNLTWFADDQVAYQLESSVDLTNWSNLGPATVGTGNFVNFPFSIVGQNKGFFRLQRLPGFAVFNGGILTITGNDLDNFIVVSRDAAGNLRINNGAVSISGGPATVANTTLIRIFGRAGNDQLSLDESNGALPRCEISGEGGNDTLTGGSGNDVLNGGLGDDILFGKGGADILLGGANNDTLTGGDADDQVFGEADNDRMVWNPGDDTDLNEGGPGADTVEVNGGNGDEQFTTTANGARVRFDRLNPAPFSIDIGTSENLVLNANGGKDSFSATGDLAALIKITVDGGTGEDTLLGSNGIDILIGGDSNDFIDGQQGNDTVLMGAGDDTFQWDPGDGSDTVEGEAGADTLLFNGSAIAELFDVSANGLRVRFTRNIATITMDLNDVESLQLNALGGADTLTVNNLAGTDLISVTSNLASTIGGATGDAAADTIIVNGTNGNDIIDVFGSGTSATVVGLSAQVNITSSEGANDSLVVNGLGGTDILRATTVPAGVIKLTLDAGIGNDSLLGSQGADVLLGGDGDDLIFGDNGDDIAFMGLNNDVFQWDPGDGNDTVEGQAGADTLLFFGSNVAETINIVANGGRILFLRDVATVTMDLDDVELIDFRALGGTDNIVVGDLSGTDLTEIGLDLRGAAGGGDAAADTVTVNGTNIADTVNAAGDASGVSVFGVQAVVNIFSQEQALDRLTVNLLGGDDVLNASSLEADGIQLTVNGGLGADILIGSEGSDLFNGGDGNDTALMGLGNDAFVWNPGDDSDVVEGQEGNDRLIFNGANVAEIFDVAPNGTRVLFTRDIATVAMDLNDVENLDVNALGGADRLAVNNLAGTDLTSIKAELAAAIGGATGDGAVDTITINGTNGDDVITADLAGDNILVSGLSSNVLVHTFEPTLDSIRVQGLAGDDILDASAGSSGGLAFVLDGGTGNDILLGSGGNDSLLGGDNDDVLLGNTGLDVLDGGLGDNIVIQDGTSVTSGIVTLFGDGLDNTITISRDAAGALLSNGLPIPGATIANTSLIRVFGRSGNDTITLNEANGALPAAALFGGAGLDVLSGGSGGDFLFGGADNDTLLGRGGFDLLFGGANNDTLTGGDADDQVFGEGDNDRMVWNPGDDTDLNEGGSGVDTVEVNGGNGDEQFTTTANGTRVRFDRLTPAPFSIDIGTSENLLLNANGGNDSFSATGNLAALIQITVNGGAGNDTLLGSNGIDLLIGGDDTDFIDGQQGNDTVFMGAGDDTFQWDPGDGSDTVEGEAGSDRMLFNGSNIAEVYEVSANGSRVRFTRNIAIITMDLNDVEVIDLNTLGGADAITVNNLAGTDLLTFNAELASTIGGSVGDGAVDVITVNGTASPDTISLAASAGAVEVIGLSTLVRIKHPEVGNDDVVINGLGGTDTFTIGNGVTALIEVFTNQ